MNIFLIGLSGAGKSTIGKQLASRLNADFIDSDNRIEEEQGLSVEDIFEKKGEEHFRELERKFLSDLMASSVRNSVVATGGGLPCFNGCMKDMLDFGAVVLLEVPLGILTSRVSKSSSRPLLRGDAKVALENQMLTRKQFYDLADVKVDASNWNAKKMDELIRRLNQINAF